MCTSEPGLWRMLSFDPHLDVTLVTSIFLCTIWTCGGDKHTKQRPCYSEQHVQLWRNVCMQLQRNRTHRLLVFSIGYEGGVDRGDEDRQPWLSQMAKNAEYDPNFVLESGSHILHRFTCTATFPHQWPHLSLSQLTVSRHKAPSLSAEVNSVPRDEDTHSLSLLRNPLRTVSSEDGD